MANLPSLKEFVDRNRHLPYEHAFDRFLEESQLRASLSASPEFAAQLSDEFRRLWEGAPVPRDAVAAPGIAEPVTAGGNGHDGAFTIVEIRPASAPLDSLATARATEESAVLTTVPVDEEPAPPAAEDAALTAPPDAPLAPPPEAALVAPPETPLDAPPEPPEEAAPESGPQAGPEDSAPSEPEEPPLPTGGRVERRARYLCPQCGNVDVEPGLEDGVALVACAECGWRTDNVLTLIPVEETGPLEYLAGKGWRAIVVPTLYAAAIGGVYLLLRAIRL